MNIVIPAAGAGKRFRDAGYLLPKPFIDVAGKPMITRVYECFVPKGQHRVVAVVPKGSPRIYDVQSIELPEVTDGAARTVSVAIHLSALRLDDPLMIVNSDQVFDWDVAKFVSFVEHEKSDGAMVLFDVGDGSARWSYAAVNEIGDITVVAEKKPISTWATAGVYYWRRTGDFLQAALDMIAAEDRTNGEFYVAPVYNYAIRQGARVAPYVISASSFHDLGTPESLQTYLAQMAPA